jgi:hypothetical protein
MAHHSHYWSCSPFADWVRGTPKGDAKTSEGWDEWRNEAERYHPVRYWLAEEGLDHLQDFVTWPVRKIHDAKYYINNRFVTRTHSLTAHPRDIRPGDWCDVGNRFLPCLFNELVDFVEIEQAWSHIAWDEEARKKYQAPFWATGWFRWRTWRCPQAGLDHLNWAGELRMTEDWGLHSGDKGYGELTGQAKNAREVRELYLWWTTVYPNRRDPYEASGWTAYCEAARLANGDKLSFGSEKSPELKKQSDRAHKLLRKLEADYEKEDEAMLIRLIKIRNSLWT